MPLTDTAARQAKPKEKDYKLADANGLFLLIKTNGSKYWRLKFRYLGVEKLLALGVYPDVKLAEARDKAAEARKHLRDGIDPGELRKLKKAAKYEAAENSFEAVGQEWFASFVLADADNYIQRIVADRVKKTERRQIGDAVRVDSADPGDGARHHKIGEQLVIIGVGMQCWVDLHAGSPAGMYQVTALGNDLQYRF